MTPRCVLRKAALLLLVALGAPARAGEHAVVLAGEDVAAVARRVGVEPAALAAANGLAVDARPSPGALLDVPAAAGDVAAAVQSFHGTGTVRLPGETPQPLDVAVPLPPRSLVCTGPESYATVRLAVAAAGRTHDDVSLLPETCLLVEATSRRAGRRTSLVSLEQGSVTVQTAEDGAERGTVTVRTAAGLTTGEGGGFRVHREPRATRTEALYNALAVVAQGAVLELQAGQGSRTRDGQAPGELVDLLPPGAPTRPLDAADLRRPDFAWRPVGGAVAYRLELSTGPRFDHTFRGQVVEAPRWEPEALVVPADVPGLWWRVAAFDGLGFLGLPSDASRLALPAGVAP